MVGQFKMGKVNTIDVNVDLDTHNKSRLTGYNMQEIAEEKETPKPSEEQSSSSSANQGADKEIEEEKGMLDITESLRKLAQLRNKMKRKGIDEKQKAKVLKK